VVAYIFIPLANIDIKLAAEKKRLDVSFVADKKTNEVSAEEGIIPAREVTEEVEKSETFKATGEKEVGEKARGTITIINQNYSTSSFNLTSGTRVVTSSGLVYITRSNVSVPGYSKKPGQDLEPGRVDVQVEASQVGERYNVTGGTMTIPALLVSGVTSADIYATGGAFAGGSSRKVKFVTANDITAAKESTTKSAEDELKSKINEKIDRDILLEGAIKTEVLSAVTSANAGTETEEFRYSVKAKGIALVVAEESLKQLAEGKLKQEIGSTKEIVEADSLVSSTKLTDFSVEEGTFRATLLGEAYIATRIDEEELRNAINGDPEGVARGYLTQLEGVDAVEIKFFPSFHRRIPRINNNIYFKIEILKTQPDSLSFSSYSVR